MTKSVRMLNCGFKIHDEILGVGKISRYMKGIGFDYSFMNEEKNVFLLNIRLSSRWQTSCQSNMLNIIIRAEVPSGNLFGDPTIAVNLGIFDPSATNFMADHTIHTNNKQPSRHQEMIVFNKYGKLRRQHCKRIPS